MTVTPQQRTYARVAAICIFADYVTQLSADAITIIGRQGETFSETAAYVAQSPVLWRFCLLNIGLSWISLAVMAYALYVLLEPVNKRLAQLALVLRLGASFVGAASLMFRVAEGRLYMEAAKGAFTIEQLSALDAVIRRGAGAGVITAWMLQGAGYVLFFLLFLRSRYIPRAFALVEIVGSAVLVVASMVMFVYPQRINELKLLGLIGLVAEVATAVWLLTKGPTAAGPGARP